MYNKKIYQKIFFFRWITITGIIMILFLQVFSLYSIFTNMSTLIEKSIYDTFSESMKKYRHIVLQKNYKKDIEFKIQSINSSVTKNKNYEYDYTDQLTIDEVMEKIISITISEEKIPINIKDLEKIFSEELNKKGINIPFNIISYDSNNKATSNDKNISRFTYQTPKIEFDVNTSVIAHYSDIHLLIIDKIIWYLIASAIIIVFVSISLIYQVSIIISQKKIEKIRQDFIDSMTHELKHPLQGVLSLAEILQNPIFSSNEEQRNSAIMRIKNNIQSVNIVINSILEKSYSDDTEYIPSLTFGNIESMINEIISNISIINYNKIINFNTTFNIEKKEYLFDNIHIYNAIRNILENSIKYSKDEPIKIDINIYNNMNNLCIEISDNGIGIKPEDINLIFKKFYRIKQNGIGFGLGLNYVKWVCQIHNGNVFVKSIYGQGTTFTLQIPILN